MKDFFQIDAYNILDLLPDASDEQIRLVYHEKIKNGQDTDVMQRAYELIRDATSRKAYLWNSVHGYFLTPPVVTEGIHDVEALIAELAFLSDWEVGKPYEL